MVRPTEKELKELGVEVDVGVSTAKFEEIGNLPEEPSSDVKIRLKSGMILRERMKRQEVDNGFSIAISNALLSEDDTVALSDEGSWRITPREVTHELRLDGLLLGRMSEQEIKNAILHAREVAAAKAENYFTGVDVGLKILGERIA